MGDLIVFPYASAPDSIGVLLSILLTPGYFGGEAGIQDWSLDFAHAYKHVVVSGDQLEFATIVLCGPEGTQCMASLGTQPFGPRLAPANWARAAKFPSFYWRSSSSCGSACTSMVDSRLIREQMPHRLT